MLITCFVLGESAFVPATSLSFAETAAFAALLKSSFISVEFFKLLKSYIGSVLETILNLLRIKFSSKIEHEFLSMQKFPLSKLQIIEKSDFILFSSKFSFSSYLIFKGRVFHCNTS